MRPVLSVEPPELFFEDFDEGGEFPVETRGPLMVGHQVRWAGATDNYDSEFHHDEYVAKAQGLPGILLSGPFIAAWLLSSINRWMGREARVLRFADRNTGWIMPREVLRFEGRVASTARQEGGGLVDLDCRVENDRGVTVTTARASLLLPSREKSAKRAALSPLAPEENARENGTENRAPVGAGALEAELQKMLGPMGEPETLPIELLAVRRMATTVEDFDPIHFDEEKARSRGYRGIVAPWPILWLLYFNCSHQRPQFSFGKATVHGEDAYAFFEPIIVGDSITVEAAVTDARVKEGRSGLLGFLTTERRFVNGSGKLCATLRTLVIRR